MAEQFAVDGGELAHFMNLFKKSLTKARNGNSGGKK